MTAELKNVTFSYSLLSADEADTAQGAAAQIRQVLGRSVVEAGKILINAKAALPHGLFRSWAEQELDMTVRTAERCMQAARFVEGKGDTVSHLPPTILYMLASPKADAEVVADVVAASEARMPLTVTQVKSRLLKAEQEAKEVAFIMKRAPKLGIEKARARRASDKVRWQQEHEEQQRVEEERHRLVQPVVERILSQVADGADDLIEILHDYNTAGIFTKLLLQALRSWGRE